MKTENQYLLGIISSELSKQDLARMHLYSLLSPTQPFLTQPRLHIKLSATMDLSWLCTAYKTEILSWVASQPPFCFFIEGLTLQPWLALNLLYADQTGLEISEIHLPLCYEWWVD